jgi:hypothetical protein
MVSIFKALNPLNILWLAILLLLTRVGYLVNVPAKIDFAFAAPFSRLLVPFNYTYSISPLQNILLACLVVYIQAILLNQLVNHFNLLGKPTFLPALMYVALSGLFTPFLVLSAPLLCNFLVIWMLYKLFSFYKNKDSKSEAFDLGMIVAIGSIIYLPFIFLFILIWMALLIFRPFNWREMMAAVIGYITVFFFLAVFYFLKDSLNHFYNIWIPLATKFPLSVNIKYLNYLVLVPVAVILALYLVKLQQNFLKSYIQVRKSFQLLFLFFMVALLSFYVEAAFQLTHFLLCAVPAAIFFSYYFALARVRWFYETLFFLLLICIIWFQFNTF